MTFEELLLTDEGSVVSKGDKKYLVVYVDFVLGMGMTYGLIRLYKRWTPVVRFVRNVDSDFMMKKYKFIKR